MYLTIKQVPGKFQRNFYYDSWQVPERPSADSRQRFRQFDFDHTFWFSSSRNPSRSSASQHEVYQTMGPHLEKAILAGYNACLLAYGQSGSGKTHTMIGTRVYLHTYHTYMQPLNSLYLIWGNLKMKSLLFLFTLEWSRNHTPPLSQPLGEIESCPSSSSHRTTQFPHGSELLGNLPRESEGSPQPNNNTKTSWTSSTRATCSRQINLSIYFFLYYLNYSSSSPYLNWLVHVPNYKKEI